MITTYRYLRCLLIILVAGTSFGCAEAKIGVGPFKALSAEVGPGGIEAKGPSAGPFKTFGVEAKPGREKDD